MPLVRRFLALSALALAGAAAAAPSTQFTVTGAVQTPAIHNLGTLQALPSVTQTVTYGSGSGTQTHTYTGAALWDVLGQSTLVLNPAAKNDVLNRIVVARGSDGYRSVFALGEISPDFGNRADLVAYSETINNTPGGLGADGFARITAAGDVKGGRYVSNLVNLDVQASTSTAVGTGGGVSSSFTVSGDVVHSTTFGLGDLQALPSRTQTVGGVSYTGVSFWDLLDSAVGLKLDPAVKNDVLGKYVIATGSDGYRAAFSLGELNPGFGNQPDLIAFSADGASLGNDGFARIVAPGDNKHGRWVSNLISLEVLSVSAVPEPGSWALMLCGLIVLGRCFSRRARR